MQLPQLMKKEKRILQNLPQTTILQQGQAVAHWLKEAAVKDKMERP